ncbi:uncharacterized protein [Typha latifolia]|uniref:uncharacterized protein n=1 Tax=Typha latifolia TaxID=4733 RepID=UPI003C2FA458
MLRQVSSRNHRSKGLRLKTALQISLLVAVTLWLLYQVKHSYDKKEYEESNSPLLIKDDGSRHEVFKFGRKVRPHREETDSRRAQIKEEENEDVEDIEQEIKREENEDEEKSGSGDDMIDELDQEKDVDAVELGEEVSEREEKDVEVDDSGLFEEEEHKEGSHEAREKSFQGDNVASAVVHNAQAAEREEASHEAREKSFQDDDASSAVAHDSQVTEHGERSHESQEKSFRGDDASSAVGHDVQMTENVNESGAVRNLDEEHQENLERKDSGLVNGAIEHLRGNESSAVNLLDASEAKNSSVVVGEPERKSNTTILLNSTVDKPNNNMEQKVDLTTTNVMKNSTEVQMSSANNLSDKMELLTNSTSLNGQAEQQLNTKPVLDNQMELLTNLTATDPITKVVSLKNETTNLDSSDDQNVTNERRPPEEDKFNLENAVTGESRMSNTVVKPEELNKSSTGSLASSDNGEEGKVKSEDLLHTVVEGRDKNTDEFNLPKIQKKANSDEEAVSE